MEIIDSKRLNLTKQYTQIMNKQTKFEDLKVGGLYDVVEYQGGNMPDLKHFVRINEIKGRSLVVRLISKDEHVIIQYHDYMMFFEVQSWSLENRKIIATRLRMEAEDNLEKTKRVEEFLKSL